MIREAFFLLFVVSQAISETCVVNSFEEELDNEFTAHMCDETLKPWIQGRYSDLPLPAPNPLSTSFISPTVPSTVWSCFATAPIHMTRYGTVKAKIHMGGESGLHPSELLLLEVYDYDTNNVVGSDQVIGAMGIIETGWHDLTITLNDADLPDSFRGSVSITKLYKVGIW